MHALFPPGPTQPLRARHTQHAALSLACLPACALGPTEVLVRDGKKERAAKQIRGLAGTGAFGGLPGIVLSCQSCVFADKNKTTLAGLASTTQARAVSSPARRFASMVARGGSQQGAKTGALLIGPGLAGAYAWRMPSTVGRVSVNFIPV